MHALAYKQSSSPKVAPPAAVRATRAKTRIGDEDQSPESEQAARPRSEYHRSESSSTSSTALAGTDNAESTSTAKAARATPKPLTWSIGHISLLPPATKAIQTKLTVNQPGDRFEQEAERVAEQVMRGPTPSAGPSIAASTYHPGIQRQCACGGSCSDCQAGKDDHEHDHVQRSSLDSGHLQTDTAPVIVDQVLRSDGDRLDTATRAFMEIRFGHDFSSVRIHTGTDAQQSASAIHARAYTVGSNIVFSSGRYAPGTRDGQHLLAHELTHVVQQSRRSSLHVDHGNLSSSKNQSHGATPSSAQVARQTVRQSTAIAIQRDPDPAKDQALSRPVEIAKSKSSPGEFTISSAFPPSMSFFNFAIDDYHLKPEHKTNLKILGEFFGLMDPSDWQVSIVGNADNTGGPEINDPLSVNRANSVRKYLASVTKGNYFPQGAGADQPITTNESVSGRSRNRRVDILFRNSNPPPPPPPPPPPDFCKQFPDQCDEKKFCERHPTICGFCQTHPVWCALGLLCIIFPAACACAVRPVLCACGRFPAVCACILDPEACLPGKRKKKKPKPKKACPIRVNRPSGPIPANKTVLGHRVKLDYPFDMDIDFKQDASGCECSCGEYTQNVRGYFDRDKTGKGTWKREVHQLTSGVFMDEKVFHEDGTPHDGPYGHRKNKGASNDKFLSPDRLTGCEYRGKDTPSVESHNKNNAKIRMHLDFEAGPVDVCSSPGYRLPLLPFWRSWSIFGEAQVPAPPSGPTKPPATPTTPPATPAPPTVPAPPTLAPPTNAPTPNQQGPSPAPSQGPSQGPNSQKLRELEIAVETNLPSGNPIDALYVSGIPSKAKSGSFQMKLAFEDNGEIRESVIPVRIVESKTTDAYVTIVTNNNKKLNLNPKHPNPVILGVHREQKIDRSILKESE
jgi:outer membrane protein OmpA-like peptidoglycan-associated protein